MRILSIVSNSSAAAVVTALGLMAAPASADSYKTRLTAYVPTSCSADFDASFSQTGADVFTLGTINQFCNTRFQLSLNHGSIVNAGRVSFGGSMVSAGSGTTMLKTLANPVANGSDALVIFGFDAEQADIFRSSLTVTVSPIAF